MTQNQNSNRILGDPYHGPTYTTAVSFVPASVGIYEDKLNRRIHFPAAGYTKNVTHHVGHSDGRVTSVLEEWHDIGRQLIINEMNARVPSHLAIKAKAILVPEPQNPFDSNAILVMAIQANESTVDSWWPIGYVPASIASKILAKWDHLLLDSGYVTIILDSKKHLVPMISFCYNTIPLNKDNRFARIQYE